MSKPRSNPGRTEADAIRQAIMEDQGRRRRSQKKRFGAATYAEAGRSVIWTAVAVALIVLAPALIHPGGLSASGLFLLGAVLASAGGIALYWSCALFWMGFDWPARVWLARVVSVYALAELGFSLLHTIIVNYVAGGAFIMVWILYAVVLLGLLMHRLDTDVADATVLTMLSMVWRVFAWNFVVPWILAALASSFATG